MTESLEDSLYKQNMLISNTKKAGPIIIIILIIALLMALFVGRYKQQILIESYGVGNPYNCITCLNLGRACDEHRGFDTSKALTDKVTRIVDRYDLSGEETSSLYAMYGYGNLYELECDFCVAEDKECYACNYDRKLILSKMEEVMSLPVFSTKLCDDCWVDKVAKCAMCKEMLVKDIIISIVGED